MFLGQTLSGRPEAAAPLRRRTCSGPGSVGPDSP